MITLYHGSYMAVKEPLVKIGRRNLDFGSGFYLTTLPEQAQKWAKAVSSRNPDNTMGFVSIYDFDASVLMSRETVLLNDDTL